MSIRRVLCGISLAALLLPGCAFDVIRVKQYPAAMRAAAATPPPWHLTESLKVSPSGGYSRELRVTCSGKRVQLKCHSLAFMGSLGSQSPSPMNWIGVRPPSELCGRNGTISPNREHSSWPRSTSTLTSKPPRLIAGRDPGSGRPRSLRVLLRNLGVWTAYLEKPIREIGRLDRVRICRASAATWARAINGHPERENGHYEQDG
jgi:hypothetical protein